MGMCIGGYRGSLPSFSLTSDSNCSAQVPISSLTGKVCSCEIKLEGNIIAFSFENWQGNIACNLWCLSKVNANSCKYTCAPAKSGGFGASLVESPALHSAFGL